VLSNQRLDAIALKKGSSRNVTAAQLVLHLGMMHKTALLMCLRLRRGKEGTAPAEPRDYHPAPEELGADLP
jgi:hypothetical protein